MQVSEIKNEGLELHYKVVVPVSKINEAVSVKLNNLAKTVTMQGFRPGKVPFKVVEQKYKQAARAEVFEKEIEDSIGSIIKEKNLQLASQSQIKDVKFEDESDLEFVVIFEKMPEVKDVDFSKIKLEKPLVTVADKDIKEKLESIISVPNYKKAAKTTKAALEDRVVIDFEGFADGVAFPGGKAEQFKLVLGSGSFIPGFEDQLVGSKAGDDVVVKVTFPASYHAKELAGKDSEFKVKVHEVQKLEKKSELNDEMAVEKGFKDLADATAKVKENFEKFYENESFTYQKMKLFDSLEGLLDFEIPKSILENEKRALLEQIKAHKDEDEDLKQKSEKELDEYATKIAARRVRIGLMLADYAKNNSITLTNDDYRKAIIEKVNQFPGMEKRVIEYYTKNKDALQSLAGPILEDKSVSHILENKVKLSEKEYTSDKFNKLMENLDIQ